MPVLLKPHTIVRGPQNSTARFYLADCIEVFKQLPSQSVDVIVTSPPYNIGVQYSQYEDTLSPAEYLEWTNTWVSAAARVLCPEGSLFLNVGARPSDPWTAMDVAQGARAHLHLQNIIHWVKSIAIDQSLAGAAAGLDRDLAVGHYKPINSDRFLNDCHEFVFHFTPRGETRLDRLALGVRYQDQSNAARWQAGAAGVRCRGNTWFIPYETIQRRDRDRPHPATFPSRLPEQCLRLHGLGRIKTVLDPFLGLGSTAVACARLGLDFIGAEIDESYLTEAVARVKAGPVEVAARISPRRGAAKMRKASLRTEGARGADRSA
jgi:site-specific DNA-methyltransferase (adenine-specific)